MFAVFAERVAEQQQPLLVGGFAVRVSDIGADVQTDVVDAARLPLQADDLSFLHQSCVLHEFVEAAVFLGLPGNFRTEVEKHIARLKRPFEKFGNELGADALANDLVGQKGARIVPVRVGLYVQRLGLAALPEHVEEIDRRFADAVGHGTCEFVAGAVLAVQLPGKFFTIDGNLLRNESVEVFRAQNLQFLLPDGDLTVPRFCQAVDGARRIQKEIQNAVAAADQKQPAVPADCNIVEDRARRAAHSFLW